MDAAVATQPSRVQLQKNHSEECRARVTAAMERLDLPGARRLREGEARVTEHKSKAARLTVDKGQMPAVTAPGDKVQMTSVVRTVRATGS